MKYEIGQKVETPLGVEEITFISEFTHDLTPAYHVRLKGHELCFSEDELKPYKTAHEKLLSMGLSLKIRKNWGGGVFSHEWWNDDNERVLVFYVDEKTTTVYEANHEIMRIIPQYLEEMSE